ncbi:MAG: hypothetical protein Fues2KO_47170 [Fuerstiella sp.]
MGQKKPQIVATPGVMKVEQPDGSVEEVECINYRTKAAQDRMDRIAKRKADGKTVNESRFIPDDPQAGRKPRQKPDGDKGGDKGGDKSGD